MSFWVHCNNCFQQPGNGTELRFYLTNCSHLFCENCVSSCGGTDTCKVCKAQCSTLLLSGKMPKDLEAMFKDPMESIQKFFKQLHQIIEFQKGQQRRFIRGLRRKIKMQNDQVEGIKNLINQAKALQRENLQLKRQNQYLSAVAKKDVPYRNSGPASKLGSKMASPHDFPYMNGGSGRLLLRTPPSGGRMGTVNSGRLPETPMSTCSSTPSSAKPHWINMFSD